MIQTMPCISRMSCLAIIWCAVAVPGIAARWTRPKRTTETALLDRVSRLVVVDDHFVLCRSLSTRSLAMETQNQTHPTPRQLAAYALNKLTPESRGRMKEHLSGCPTCSTFISQTPQVTLPLQRNSAAAPAQNGGSISEGIAAERHRMAPIRRMADVSSIPRNSTFTNCGT